MGTGTAPFPAFLSPEVETDPYAFYRRLRAESPVHWDQGLGGYLLTRHSQVADAYRSRKFSTGNYATQLEPVFGRSLLQMDGAEHSRKRALVSPHFKGEGLDSWLPAIHRNVALILDRSIETASSNLAETMRPGQSVDLLHDFGYYLPVFVITDMLGLPHSDYDRFFEWYTAHVNFLGNLRRDPEIDRIGVAATQELWAYLTPIIEERRQNPGSDLISALVTAEVQGESLVTSEVLTHVTQILNAGSETTGKTLANIFCHLLSDRRLYEAVRDDRSLVLPAISESLRFTPPSQMNGRQAVEDIEIEGTLIPAGSLVMLIIASANRDERRFEASETFDIHRKDLDHEKAFSASGDHFAFGFGRHFCLGSNLARNELEISMNVLLDRFPDMRLADGQEPRWSGLKMRSVESLPVIL